MSDVLLISDLGASSVLTGGIFLKQFIEGLPSTTTISQIVIQDPSLRSYLQPLKTGDTYYAQKPSFTSIPRQISALSYPFWKTIVEPEIKKLTKWVQRLLDEIQPQVVLIAVQCPQMCSIVSSLNFGCSRTIAFWWDHPDLWAEGHRITGQVKAVFYENFFKILSSCDVVVAPSEGVAKSGHIADPDKIVVLYPHIVRPPQQPKNEPLQVGMRSIRIGYAGLSSYAFSEIKEFVNFLESERWSVKGCSIEFHIFGVWPKVTSLPGVKYWGHLPPEQLALALGQLDFAFLPYPFEEKLRNVSRTSFPAKLSVYSAAGLPTLYYGPDDSSVADFLRENGGAILLSHPPKTSEIETAIRTRDRLRAEATENYHRFFSPENLQRLIGDVAIRLSLQWSLEKIPGDGGANLEAIPLPDKTDDSSFEHNKNRVLTYFSFEILRHFEQAFSQEKVPIRDGPIDSFSYPSFSKYFIALIHPKITLSWLGHFLAKLKIPTLTVLGVPLHLTLRRLSSASLARNNRSLDR